MAGQYKLGDPETGLLDDKQKEIIRRAAGLGSSLNQIGYLLGVSKPTWREYIERHAGEIEDLYEEGKAQAELQVSNSLFQNAVRGSLGHITWYERTRAGRKDSVEHEITDKRYVVEAPAPVSLDEWQRLHADKAGNAPIEIPHNPLPVASSDE